MSSVHTKCYLEQLQATGLGVELVHGSKTMASTLQGEAGGGGTGRDWGQGGVKGVKWWCGRTGVGMVVVDWGDGADQSAPLGEVVCDRFQAANVVVNDGGTEGGPLPPHHTHPCQPQPGLAHLYLLTPALKLCLQWGSPRRGGEGGGERTARGRQWLDFTLSIFIVCLMRRP